MASKISKTDPRLLEKHIEEAFTQILELDGWRSLKTDPVSDRLRGKGFGELGMADHLYLRYIHNDYRDLLSRAGAQVLWIEYKRKGGRYSPYQEAWHRDERLRGALTLRVGIDCPPTFEGCMEWYEFSGLSLLTLRKEGLLKSCAKPVEKPVEKLRKK